MGDFMKIIDLHCDTLYKFTKTEYSIKENNGHVTEKGLKKADYLAQCFAIYLPTYIRGEDGFLFFKKQYNRFLKIIEESEDLEIAKKFEDIKENSKKCKISAVLTVENAEFLNGELERLKFLKDCGIKILGLVHNGENCLGFPHNKTDLPLKDFGKEVVSAVNDTDIVIDVSHLNLGGFLDVANISKKPFIASHSACMELQNHSRNLFDEQIKIIANSGGIIGVPFYSVFLNGTNKTEIFDIICHIEHLIKVGGEDVAALGTDFDGMECEMFLKTCADMPVLKTEIIKKFGYQVAEKICYKNALRILNK